LTGHHQKWLIAFDMDDTLFPEKEFVKSGFQAVAKYIEKKFNETKFFDTAWNLFLEGRRGDIFDQAISMCGLKESRNLVKELVNLYREHKPSLKLFPDAKSLLARLEKRHHLAIITDGNLLAQKNKASALGIESMMEKIIYTDEFGPDFWKPSPFAYQELMRLFNVQPELCIYIADNPKKDFIAPNQLGWKTVQVKRPDGEYSKTDAPLEYQAQKVITSLEDLTELYPLIGHTAPGR
jgi:putative hydrolase of the HAD superfamily